MADAGVVDQHHEFLNGCEQPAVLPRDCGSFVTSSAGKSAAPLMPRMAQRFAARPARRDPHENVGSRPRECLSNRGTDAEPAPVMSATYCRA